MESKEEHSVKAQQHATRAEELASEAESAAAGSATEAQRVRKLYTSCFSPSHPPGGVRPGQCSSGVVPGCQVALRAQDET